MDEGDCELPQVGSTRPWRLKMTKQKIEPAQKRGEARRVEGRRVEAGMELRITRVAIRRPALARLADASA
jgi:hypothetical protein